MIYYIPCIISWCPLSCNSLTISRHCWWNRRSPSCKSISSLCRICWSCNSCIVILSNRSNVWSSICIKCNCILIDIPKSCNSHTSSWHSFRNFFIPSSKCISLLCRIIYLWNNCIIILSNISNWSTTICVEMNCILINSPSSINCHIFSWHSLWNALIPTCKCISSFTWIWNSWNICSIHSSNWSNYTSAICIKCNCRNLSWIIIIHHCTSCSRNCSSLSCRRSKSFIWFDCWSNFAISSSFQWFKFWWLIWICSIQFLLKMIYSIRSICIRSKYSYKSRIFSNCVYISRWIWHTFSTQICPLYEMISCFIHRK